MQAITPGLIKLFSILAFLLSTSPSFARVDDNKICTLYADTGHCLQYYLPFDSTLTIQDYIDAIAATMPEETAKETYKYKDATYTIKIVKKLLKALDKLKTPKLAHAYEASIRQYFMIALLILRDHGHRVYPMNRMTLLHQIHTLYALLNSMTFEAVPDFTDLVIGEHFNFNKFQKEGNKLQMLIGASSGALSEHLLVFTALRAIQSATNAYFLYSTENINWLLNYAPELKTKKVIELGAGNGLLVRSLEVEGVDIEATDLKPSQVTLNYRHIRKLSAKQAMKAYQGSDEEVIFLISMPGWNIKHNIRQLLDIKNGTVIIISEIKMLEENLEEFWPEQLQSTVTKLPSTFRTIYSQKNFKPHIYKFQHRESCKPLKNKRRWPHLINNYFLKRIK